MNLRNTILLNAMAVGLGAGACGTSSEALSDVGGAGTDPGIEVAVAEVRVASDRGALEIPAVIESNRRAILTSRFAASVVAFDLREGDAVNAGDVLVRLEDGALKAALSAAETAGEVASRDLQRAEALFVSGAATLNEVENAGSAAERARAAAASAREAVAHATLRAPFSGRILRKLANAGDIVNPGQPLLEIEGQGGLEVTASIHRDLRDHLGVGQKVKVRVDGLETPLEAVIHSLAASAEPSTHRFTLRADILPSPHVRAGLFARVLVSSPDDEPRLLVPSHALVRRGGLVGVYVIRDGRAWLRWIAPGNSSGDEVEVRAGLEAKERVALDPSRLNDGAVVSGVPR